MTTLEQLLDARSRISRPRDWVQGGSAQTLMGEWIEPNNPRAVAWCAYGACRAACLEFPLDESVTGWLLVDDRIDEAFDQLHPDYDRGYIDFNDEEDTKHEQILRIFDLAIKLEREKVNGKA